jgi:hypothetical protein
MRRLLMLAVATGLAGAAPAASGVSSGLRGVVRVPRPVCLQDDPCDGAAAGVKLAFARNGHIVARVTSGQLGRYRLVLPAGVYTVTSPGAMSPKSHVSPSPVRVVPGRFRQVDFFVDTGIRAP